MKSFITYDPQTGEIKGRYQLGPTQEGIYSNLIEIDDATFASIPERTMRVENGKLVKKNEVIPSPNKVNFTANGVDSATITYNVLSGVGNVFINGILRGTIDSNSNTVTISSDTPGNFIVKLQSHHDYAEPVTVVAQ